MAKNSEHIGMGAFLTRLARDRAGNTLAIIAAAILPLLAMVGGGFDMGRSYLAQSRLQQACDAGVLAARKKLGADTALTGAVSKEVADIGQRFFNINFRDGAYGTKDRSFVMELGSGYQISGNANVTVPTSIMRIFGYDEVDIAVECEAQINFANTDVMMVLDVTGSMAQINAGDSISRLDALKNTVKLFHHRLDASSQAGSVIRYGFVPYSTNVNVAHLLKDEWMVDEWPYQSRQGWTTEVPATYTYSDDYEHTEGTFEAVDIDTYQASFSESLGYYCPTSPSGDYTSEYTVIETTTENFTGPPEGEKVTKTIKWVRNGKQYYAGLDGQTCKVKETTFSNYEIMYKEITEPSLAEEATWLYAQYWFDVGDFRTKSTGCIEERATYEIDDYDNVNLSRALDLNLDLVPGGTLSGPYTRTMDNVIPYTGDEWPDAAIPSLVGGGPMNALINCLNMRTYSFCTTLLNLVAKDQNYNGTKWRPMYPDRTYVRGKNPGGYGVIETDPMVVSWDYINASSPGYSACPAPARKLAPMTEDEIKTYLDSLHADGSTYHDIGMIWGGRLISPTGLFAAENADRGGAITGRHLIFLTDGETETLTDSYASYGIEPLDQRRWSPDSTLDLNETVEKRFLVACNEVRKRNVIVWVVGFGIDLSDVMKQCAGEGHYFAAADAAELNATFATIADSIADLRISK